MMGLFFGWKKSAITMKSIEGGKSGGEGSRGKKGRGREGEGGGSPENQEPGSTV